MLSVRDLMIPDPITVAPEDTLRVAADVLASAGIGGAPVVAGKTLVGVVTLADILTFEAEDPGVGPPPRALRELGPDEEPSPGDEVDGIAEPASAAWFLDLWSEDGPDAVTRMEGPEDAGWNALDDHVVAEVMSRAIVQVSPDTPIGEAARAMERQRIHRLIVVEGDAVVGILSSSDIVRAVAEGRFGAEHPADLSLG
jgi:CBS domain-containing protein